MGKLEPCPFCKGINAKMDSSRDKRGYTIHFGKCVDCGGMGPELRNYEKAVNSWNACAGRGRRWYKTDECLPPPPPDGHDFMEYITFTIRNNHTSPMDYYPSGMWVWRGQRIDPSHYWAELPAPPEEEVQDDA